MTGPLLLATLDSKPGTASPPKVAPAPAEMTLSRGELVVEMAIPGEDGLPQEIRLFKAGEHASTKGTFIFDTEAASSVLSRAEKYGNDYFFDYGHASLDDAAVDPAKAGRSAGSFRLQIRNGELWTKDLRLTEEAKSYLRDRQYRYVSPAFRHRDGHIVEFINAALTNMPATLNQPPIVLKRGDETPTQPERKMEQLLAALGLSKNATEAEALAKLKAVLDRGTDLAVLTGKSSPAEQQGVLEAWKTKAEKMPEVSAKLEKLEAEIKEERVQKAVRLAIKKGTLPPALKEKAIELGRKDLGFLKGFLSEMKPLVDPKGSATEKAPDESTVGLSKELAEVCATLSLDPKKVAAVAAKGIKSVSKEDDED